MDIGGQKLSSFNKLVNPSVVYAKSPVVSAFLRDKESRGGYLFHIGFDEADIKQFVNRLLFERQEVAGSKKGLGFSFQRVFQIELYIKSFSARRQLRRGFLREETFKVGQLFWELFADLGDMGTIFVGWERNMFSVESLLGRSIGGFRIHPGHRAGSSLKRKGVGGHSLSFPPFLPGVIVNLSLESSDINHRGSRRRRGRISDLPGV